MGTSAGGARPKLLIAEIKKMEPSFRVMSILKKISIIIMKLSLETNQDYKPELIEYTYYLIQRFRNSNDAFKLIDENILLH
ncbi:MAG: hypothetical protein R2784_15860 [Saprospiraceae bacterium]